MKIKIFTLLVTLLVATATLAQDRPRIVGAPTKVLVNVNSGLYEIALDNNLAGVGMVLYKSDVPLKAKVHLDPDGGLSLSIPAKGAIYNGRYDIISVFPVKNGKASKPFVTAVVKEWDLDHWAQNASLDQLRPEINWRAENYNAKVVVDKHNLRVYETPTATIAMAEIGAVLSSEEFTIAKSGYSARLQSYRGALIFDAKNGNLIMRIIENGRDVSYAIKKNGEVHPISPSKKVVQPKLGAGGRARIV